MLPQLTRLTPLSRGCRCVGASLVVLVAALLLVSQGRLDDLSYDLAYLVRPPDQAPDTAVLILMDNDSYVETNQSRSNRWDRGIHAQLLDWLTACKPSAVIFDQTFENPGTNSTQEVESDRRFVEAVTANGNV